MRKLIVFISLFLIPLAFAAGVTTGGSEGYQRPPCDDSVWTCTKWTECNENMTQSRTCRLTRDCPGAYSYKPFESVSCKPDSKYESSLRCHNLESRRERISCRLSLSSEDVRNELQIAYLPEECRTVANPAKKDMCIKQYSDSQACWKLPMGIERHNCLRVLLNIENITQQKEQCVDTACRDALKERVYALIKFRIYDLEERAEALHEEGKITEEMLVSIIDALEAKKEAFNQATTKEERKTVLLDVKMVWTEFIRGIQ